MGIAAALLLAIGRPQAQSSSTPTDRAPVTIADYERAAGLRQRFEGLVTGEAGTPVWLAGDRFWYRVSVAGGHEFVLVDATAGRKAPAFDHARVAAALSRATGRSYSANTLPFSTFTFDPGERDLTFRDEKDAGWTCTPATDTCATPTTAAPTDERPAPAGPGGGGRGNRLRDGADVPSPDGRTIAYVRDGNIAVRADGASRDAGTTLSTTGTTDLPFTPGEIVWSPDSKKIAASRVMARGDRRTVRYVQSSPDDQLQPRTFERVYAKPGDALDQWQRVLLSVDGGREAVIDNALFPTPYSLSRIVWRKDSRAFTFEYNQRGHQVYRVLEVDGTTGAVRTIVDEQSSTFVDYRRANGSLADSGRTFRFDLADGAETIWMSERDGWAHLYLYDGVTGRVKRQITKGPWLVRSVERVDENARQIWFSAGGMTSGQDPYFAQYYRIDIDGTGLMRLTDADANHSVSFSPDFTYYVDTWSRVDLAPVTQLRRASDGRVLMDLERADLRPLTAAGWRAPEVFVAKGRDGATDIWGVIIRPTNFDPARRYPVIENIYAGPQGSFVPRSFNAFYGMQALAELGFVVVQIDGMGTANRSKAFHDVAWQNLADAGFPDRILWHQAAAKKYPWYDISRAGIYGGSAGGQNALGALLFHPELYKAAVSFAGCHDNRMDKIWWNEQWMGWPIGPQYAASSNVVHAGNLRGDLLLVVGELDTNVDPSSTMQVVNALVKANKQFDLLVMPGEDHGAGRRGPSAPYGDRKLWDFFVRHLLDSPTPNWNETSLPPATTADALVRNEPSLWGPSWADVEASWNSGGDRDER